MENKAACNTLRLFKVRQAWRGAGKIGQVSVAHAPNLALVYLASLLHGEGEHTMEFTALFPACIPGSFVSFSEKSN